MEVFLNKDELATCCKDLNKLCTQGRQIKAISPELKESFDSLDLNIEDDLRLKYLLLHAHEKLTSNHKVYKNWLMELKKNGVTSELLDLVTSQKCLSEDPSCSSQREQCHNKQSFRNSCA